MHNAALCAAALLLLCAAPAHAPAEGTVRDAAPPPSIVPQPRFLRATNERFVWPARTTIAAGTRARYAADAITRYLRAHGVTARLARAGERAAVTIEADAERVPRLGPEAYALSVRRDRIVIRANGGAGAFYALQTLEQITDRSRDGLATQGATVVDAPRFRWRGIHLDVARHFFPVPVVERYIDVAARYKLNVFHWHLTDDQAWRMPLARYPALGRSGPRYSEADVAAVIDYAQRRYVTVVPEIDMPAHADAALRAYPELACTRETVCDRGASGRFVRDAIAQTARLFPSPYLHTGGDEVPPPARASQAAFTRAVVNLVRAKRTRAVVWDDAYTPQLDRDAVVMVWTQRKHAAEILRHGHDVVVASAPLYFDAVQGDPRQEPRGTNHMSTLEQVYSDPIAPDGVTGTAAAHLLGAEATLWTEHIATEDRLFTMLLPRELALAESAWTPRERKSWPSFLARLPAQLARLHADGYAFRIPNAAFAFTGGAATFAAIPGRVQSVDVGTASPSLTVALSVPLRGAVIRYTTDGAEPSAASAPYAGPFPVNAATRPLHLRAAAFFGGRRGAVSEAVLRHAAPASLNARKRTSASWSSLVSP
jgi:hexosaminidase